MQFPITLICLVCIIALLFLVFMTVSSLAKAILSEVDKISVLLTVIANKQGCTADDIDVALGRKSAKKTKKSAEKSAE